MKMKQVISIKGSSQFLFVSPVATLGVMLSVTSLTGPILAIIKFTHLDTYCFIKTDKY